MKCSISECVEERTLYNVNYPLQQIGALKDAKWYCVYHIPKEATFIVGLHGDELKKAGR